MQGNGVGSGLFSKQCRLDWIGIGGAAHLPKRSDVIDINTQPYHFFLGKIKLYLYQWRLKGLEMLHVFKQLSSMQGLITQIMVDEESH